MTITDHCRENDETWWFWVFDRMGNGRVWLGNRWKCLSWLILAGFRKRWIRSADLSFLSKEIEHSSGTVGLFIPHLSGQKDNSFFTEQVVKLHEFWGKGKSPKDRYFVLPILLPNSLYTMCLDFFQPSSAYIQSRPIASSAEWGAALCPSVSRDVLARDVSDTWQLKLLQASNWKPIPNMSTLKNK